MLPECPQDEGPRLGGRDVCKGGCCGGCAGAGGPWFRGWWCWRRWRWEEWSAGKEVEEEEGTGREEALGRRRREEEEVECLRGGLDIGGSFRPKER